MATAFDEIAGFVRAVLGDTDSENFVYTQDAIEQHIRLLILTQNGMLESASFLENPLSTGNFTGTLTAKAKVLCIFSVAKGLISPVPNFFSYRTPVQSASRSGHTLQLLAWIDENLSKLRGGSFPISSDDELQAIILGPSRFWNQYNAALAKSTL